MLILATATTVIDTLSLHDALPISTILGSGVRTIATIGTNTFDLVSDLTLPAGGLVLSLGGTPTLTSSTGTHTLTNTGSRHVNTPVTTINANVTLANQGSSTLSNVT